MQEPVAQWQFWIDRGGTFTDVVARRPDGTLVTTKLLSEDPERRYDAAEAAIRQLTGVGDGPLPHCAIRIGTTIATNALLERQGEPVLLAITRGFGDALTIGNQDRPDIFARDIRRPAPLFAEVVEIEDRTGLPLDALGQADKPKGRMLQALAYISKRRDNPDFTWEMAGALKISTDSTPVDPSDGDE